MTNHVNLPIKELPLLEHLIKETVISVRDATKIKESRERIEKAILMTGYIYTRNPVSEMIIGPCFKIVKEHKKADYEIWKRERPLRKTARHRIVDDAYGRLLKEESGTVCDL